MTGHRVILKENGEWLLFYDMIAPIQEKWSPGSKGWFRDKKKAGTVHS